ncbi:DUF5107 domain-containing protein [Arachidicoccus terrestris]|uniref:DUF5107 domain-containing protein n=1 Tax=Arachidicoccus terrestris TaxID=2875539 RepID=UPI001CC688F3|nr:DUF5107 domain-containing protein [Arachidicoccus terrestris]UAY56882.1 DUF5107 domain-containing protein [Arachidicoccus terrestris]
MERENVKVWKEVVSIPTYGVGKPEKNPMFFEKRVYQGSSGVVYPNAIIEKILDIRQDEQYMGLFLENEYIKVMILPELGGRIQMAYDKIGQRHFIYYNQVIKPALVGLTGPWISGGIEFNWPQHHRPSTFEPVDFEIGDGPEGSKVVYINEVEKMFHTKAMIAFTLYPGKAYIEVNATLYNRSALPQTFLWWANPAVKVNDFYQSVFPSDVNAVFDHGKRDVSDFPIATGTYYKVDYSPGTDISFYKNIPVPTSYMAVNSAYDFVGGYEHDTGGGLLHVADHHVSPGKKQWTWGHSDFGQAWDRNLTDEDGPYIELMTGMYTDNQPDFTWIMPYESKTFSQYFLPYRELGLIKNASKDILLAVEAQEGQVTIKLFATSRQSGLQVRVNYNGTGKLETSIDLDPTAIFEQTVLIDGLYEEDQVEVYVRNSGGRIVLRYLPAENNKKPLPEAAKAALPPKEVQSTEQLFLTGQHLEQYRHATYSPVPYYEEALRREPTDIRNNTALGVWYLRRGRFAQSLPYFETAIRTITTRNPNPYDGEPYYHLGLALRYLNRYNEAYDAFFKATWNKAWKDAGYFSVAQIDMLRGEYELAADHLSLAVDFNAGHSKAYTLLAVALRKQGLFEKAEEVVVTALEKDLFNLGVRFEYIALLKDMGHMAEAAAQSEQLWQLSRGDDRNFIEYGLDLMDAGLHKEAIDLFAIFEQHNGPDMNPMIYYYLGWSYARLASEENSARQARSYYAKAAAANSYLCFPNRLQDILILEYALKQNPQDGKAAYYLGNLFYDKRQYEKAIDYWLLSARIDPDFPTVQRNLGIAFFNKRKDSLKAKVYFERAFQLDQTDARVFMELDQLYKRLNTPVEERLGWLIKHLSLTRQRDDTYLEYITLLNLTGEFKKAGDMLLARKFHPWEGGEGKVSGQYVLSMVEQAKQCICNGDAGAAIKLLEAAQVYPHNLGEGKLYGALENDIFYWLGVAYEKAGSHDMADKYYQAATKGNVTLANAMYYNDQQPDKIFYQGLAWRKLGNNAKAKQLFNQLVNHGREHEHEQVSIEYFAVSLPNLLIFEDDLSLRNRLNCLYLKGLGYLGLKEFGKAESCFREVLKNDNTHMGAFIHTTLLKYLDLLV